MNPEDIFVLVLTACFVGFVLWLAIHTRLKPKSPNSVVPTAKPTHETPQVHSKIERDDDLLT